MSAIAGAFIDLLTAGGKRALTPEETADVNDALDAAADWAAGRLPWELAANVGTVENNGRPSPSFTRFIATVLVSPLDPRRPHLKALIGHLLVMQGLTVTDGGIYTQRDLNELHEAEDYMRGRAA
ncbi:MAG: hypothetical protein ACR2OE_14955 [Thermomicrobiales bacterium]